MQWFVIIILISASGQLQITSVTSGEMFQASADVYPSERAAVDAMVNQFVSKLRSTPEFHETGSKIYICESHTQTRVGSSQSSMTDLRGGVVAVRGGSDVDKNATQLAIQSAMAECRRRFQGAKIIKQDDRGDVSPDDIVMTIGLTNVQQIERGGETRSSGYHGNLNGVLTHDGREEHFEAKFVHKRWVDDFADFLSIQPSKTWAVGRSNKPCSSQMEADNLARRAVGVKIAQILQSRRINNLPSQVVEELVTQQLMNQGTADRFVQQIATPDQTLWTSSILVSTSDESLQQLLPQIPELANARTSDTWAGNIKSVFVIGLVIVVLYFVLNGITRGYYSGSIRLAVVLAVVLVAVLGVLFVMFFSARAVSVPSARITVNQ